MGWNVVYCSITSCSVAYCSCSCSWNCYKILTFCSLLTRCATPCACHAKRYLSVQKWSDVGVFCAFWFGNVLRATTACIFSTSQLLKVLWSWSVLCILTWKCASRDIGVQFFISHLASWLRTRRFREPTFRPSGATNRWKNTVNRDFPTFWSTCLFFLPSLSLLAFFFCIDITMFLDLKSWVQLGLLYNHGHQPTSWDVGPCNCAYDVSYPDLETATLFCLSFFCQSMEEVCGFEQKSTVY